MKIVVKWPSLRDHLQELLNDDINMTLDEHTSFSYNWERGVEQYEITHHRTDSGLEYSGVYHPEDDGMCIDNPCKYCGDTYIEDENVWPPC